MRRRVVKRALWLGLVVVFVVFAVSACGGGGAEEGGGEQAEQEATESGKSLSTDEFQPAFTISVSKDWAENDVFEKSDYYGISLSAIPDTVNFLNAHTVYDVPSGKNIPAPSDLTAWFQQHPYLETSQPTPVTVGGVSGKRFDLTSTKAPSEVLKDFPKARTEGAGCSREGDECIPAFVLNSGDTYNFYLSNEYRVIILDDVAGETVAIVEAKLPDDPFLTPEEKSANKKFFTLAEELLSTVEWKAK